MKSKTKKVKIAKNNVTLSFLPFSELSGMESNKKINKILDMALENRIIILQGRLSPTEEASLIQSTMALVGRVSGFKGVELAVVSGNNNDASVMNKVREGLAKMLVGDQGAITVIGPATIVKDIKKDPRKIDLLLKD